MQQTILQIKEQLSRRGATVSTAESCTGGLVGHLLTNLSGSSSWYVGGAVSYSNDLKRGVLGVEEEALARYGAVSAEVAEQMAVGARASFGSDYAISVTGIAGPGGGSEEKPVGLTYIGVATPEQTVVRRFLWQGSREGNKYSSAGAALDLLLEVLKADDEAPEATRAPSRSAAVEAHFGVDGAIQPLAFIWRGQKMKVVNWGRRWAENGRRHFLVMTLDNRVWELRFEEQGMVWTIHPKSEARYVV